MTPLSLLEDDAAAVESADAQSEKIVIQFGDRTIKGFLESQSWNTIEELLRNAPHTPPKTFRVRHLDSGEVEEIPTNQAKAVFYVNSFEGDEHHKPLHFHSRAPIAHGVWVRLLFQDGEVMEGIVHNSIHYLTDPGFFLQPTDPDSNNRLVYVMKSWLKDHRILGLRKL